MGWISFRNVAKQACHEISREPITGCTPSASKEKNHCAQGSKFRVLLLPTLLQWEAQPEVSMRMNRSSEPLPALPSTQEHNSATNIAIYPTMANHHSQHCLEPLVPLPLPLPLSLLKLSASAIVVSCCHQRTLLEEPGRCGAAVQSVFSHL